MEWSRTLPFPDDLRLASSQVVLLLPPTSADPWCQGSPAASILPSGVRVSVNLSFFQFPSRVVHADPFNSLIANLFLGQIPQCRAAGASKEGGARTSVVDDWWTGSCRGCSATLQYFYCSPPLAARTTFTTWKVRASSSNLFSTVNLSSVHLGHDNTQNNCSFSMGAKNTLTSQELRMLSRSLSDCKSLLLNVMIQVSQFIRNGQLCH